MPAWRDAWSDEQAEQATAELDRLAVEAAAERAEQDACESIEAEEVRWDGIMAAQPDWMRNVWYPPHQWMNRG